MSGETVHLWWYNPRDGYVYDMRNERRQEPFLKGPAEGLVTLDPPGMAGADHDWVLGMDDADACYEAPGSLAKEYPYE